MLKIGFFEIVLAIAALAGVWILLRNLRLPKSFNENQSLFRGIQKKLRQQEQDGKEEES